MSNGEDEKMGGGEKHCEGGAEEKKLEGEGGEKIRHGEEGGENPEGEDGKEQEGEGGEEQEGEEGVVHEDPLTSLLVLELECPVCLSPMVGSAHAAVGHTSTFTHTHHCLCI